MKAFQAQFGAGLAGLESRERDRPQPGASEVLIRVRANSLNYRELSILKGTYLLPVKPDVVMGADGAGEVVALGEGVTRVRLGDRVAVAMFPRWMDGPFGWDVAAQTGGSLDGMMTEFVAVNENGVVQIPEHLSYLEAATLPCAAVTAWNAITGGQTLSAGHSVLTLGSGGVALFALQFAKLFGARVIATTSSDAKAEKLRALGADEVINYQTTPAWDVRVREATGGRGVDQVVDVGGNTLDRSIRAVAVSGQVSFIGGLGGIQTVDANGLYRSIASIRVVAAGSRAQFVAMNRAISVGKLNPLIDRVFPFSATVEAFRYYQETKPFGKVVIEHV